MNLVAKFFVALFLIVSSLNVSAKTFMVDGIYYETVTWGTNEVMVAEAPDAEWYKGDIVIPSKVTYDNVEYSVGYIKDAAFYLCQSLISVVIPEGVSQIYSESFGCCFGLKSVTIPSTVTYIGESAFDSCESLTSITIPDGVINIDGWAFNCCTSLAKIEIPKSVRKIGLQAFGMCSNLTEINVNAENSKFASVDGVLYDKDIKTLLQCPGGKSAITIPNTVVNIEACAFCDCRNLQSLDIPANVSKIGDEAFGFCTSIKSLSIPEGVEYIGELMFRDCRALEAVSLPNSVTFIGEAAFMGCDKLETLTIPNKVAKMGEIFADCELMSTIYCSPTTPPEVVYEYCSENIMAKATLYVPIGCKSAYESADYWKGFRNIKEYDFAGVEDIKNAEVAISVIDGKIVVNGVECVDVFAIDGKLVYSGSADGVSVDDKGIYIVVANGKSYKVIL